MLTVRANNLQRRKDDRIIIHFDYDCFYAAVFEAENPGLKSLPLAVQQKQIIVTCNYVARRRGLHKLQLITEAKRVCPEAIIVLGEDLTRFRDASKLLYNALRAYSWNNKVERLGFDEVWMDVTDMVDYNMELLNENNLTNSYFHLSLSDPTLGFPYDASSVAGNVYPVTASKVVPIDESETRLHHRLSLGSHLAFHLRHKLDEQYGYTSTVGISTSKMISKLVGNKNKPRGQTTLMPPYNLHGEGCSNVLEFLDDHDIGAIPSIGFKLAQKLREHILDRPANFESGLIYGPTRETVTVKHVRESEGLSSEMLDRLLSGPGAPHGIGTKIYSLLNGIDEAEVIQARSVPRQISIEDSYVRLDTMEQVLQQLKSLSTRLLQRMRIDLTDAVGDEANGESTGIKWLAHPSTLRLTTRPRLALNSDGTRTRSFKRISRSGPLPLYVFNLSEPIDNLANRLIKEELLPLFRRLHSERSGWNLSLVNIAVTGMAEEARGGRVGNIGNMFKNLQQDVEKFEADGEDDEIGAADDPATDLTTIDVDYPLRKDRKTNTDTLEAFDARDTHAEWEDDSSDDQTQAALDYTCGICGGKVLSFARTAHDRFHELGD